MHSGFVWIEGSTPAAALPVPVHGDFNQDFGLATPREEMRRPTNTLALPRPCANSEQFDKRFRKKLLRIVTLFRDADGKLFPPLPDDVVVAGTLQARAFEDAGIEVKLVRAETLIDEGFENDFLFELAPTHKRKPKPQPKPTPLSKELAAKIQVAKIPIAPPGKASARYDSEESRSGHSQAGRVQANPVTVMFVNEFRLSPGGVYIPFVRDGGELVQVAMAPMAGAQEAFLMAPSAKSAFAAIVAAAKRKSCWSMPCQALVAALARTIRRSSFAARKEK